MHQQATDFPYQKIPGYKWVWGIIVGLIALSYYPLPGMIVFLIGVGMSMRVLNSPANKSARLYNKGLHVYKKGFKDMAIQLWEEALKKDSLNIYPHQALCYLYHDYEKNPALALEHGKKALELDAHNTRVGYKVGKILYEMGDFPQAAHILQSLDLQGELAEERAKLLKKCLAGPKTK